MVFKQRYQEKNTDGLPTRPKGPPKVPGSRGAAGDVGQQGFPGEGVASPPSPGGGHAWGGGGGACSSGGEEDGWGGGGAGARGVPGEGEVAGRKRRATEPHAHPRPRRPPPPPGSPHRLHMPQLGGSLLAAGRAGDELAGPRSRGSPGGGSGGSDGGGSDTGAGFGASGRGGRGELGVLLARHRAGRPLERVSGGGADLRGGRVPEDRGGPNWSPAAGELGTLKAGAEALVGLAWPAARASPPAERRAGRGGRARARGRGQGRGRGGGSAAGPRRKV
jgi:hypothetical protein